LNSGGRPGLSSQSTSSEKFPGRDTVLLACATHLQNHLCSAIHLYILSSGADHRTLCSSDGGRAQCESLYSDYAMTRTAEGALCVEPSRSRSRCTVHRGVDACN